MTGCLTCCHAKFTAHDEWKPKYQGQTFNHHAAEEFIRETKKAIPVTCTLYPQWIDFNTNHYCGQWSPVSGRTLLQEVKNTEDASNRWRSRMWEAEADNAALRTQLKAARERSAKRLDKLRAVAQ